MGQQIFRLCLSTTISIALVFSGVSLRADISGLAAGERELLIPFSNPELLDQQASGGNVATDSIGSKERESLNAFADNNLLDQRAGQDPGEVVTTESPYAQQHNSGDEAAVAAIILVGAFVFVLVIVAAASA